MSSFAETTMGNKTASQPVASQTDTYESFPTPTRQPVSALSPVIWPGISAESSEALQSILKDNHKRWNIFFNDAGFHKRVIKYAITSRRNILIHFSVMQLTMS
jgi:hypothetical protein